MNEVWESLLGYVMFYITLFGILLYFDGDRKHRPKE